MHSAADDLLFSPDCHRRTEVVLDHATGDTICTECALVLDARFVDEGSEWRSFADDGGGEDRDPSRVGGRNDPFLDNAPLDTRIVFNGPPKTQSEGGHALPRMRIAGGPDPDQTLVEVFRAIADMADRLGLVATIQDRAKDVYKKMDEAKARAPGARSGTSSTPPASSSRAATRASRGRTRSSPRPRVPAPAPRRRSAG